MQATLTTCTACQTTTHLDLGSICIVSDLPRTRHGRLLNTGMLCLNSLHDNAGQLEFMALAICLKGQKTICKPTESQHTWPYTVWKPAHHLSVISD